MGFSSRVVAVVFNVITLTSSLAVAADDDYLKMLEEEARDLEVDKSGQLEQKQEVEEDTAESLMNINLKSADALEAGIMPPDLTHEEFVSVLKENFYGSYVFYQKLNSNDQQTVYYHYKESSPAYLDAIREDILDLMKNR